MLQARRDLTDTFQGYRHRSLPYDGVMDPEPGSADHGLDVKPCQADLQFSPTTQPGSQHDTSGLLSRPSAVRLRVDSLLID